MFQFPGLAALALWIQARPVRAPRDQRSFDSSPGLFAVFHALRRLLAPRHPPHALSSLAALIPSLAQPDPHRPAPPRFTAGGAGTRDRLSSERVLQVLLC